MLFYDCFTYNIAQIAKEVKWKKYISFYSQNKKR